MRILVCFKVLPCWEKVLESDWEHFAPGTDISYAGTAFNCLDEAALELALRIREQAAKRGEAALCTAATVGKIPSAPLIETLYAAGFDEVAVLEDDRADFDPGLVSSRLSDYLKERSFDLIICGPYSGMADTGAVPFLLAARLGLPTLAGARELSLGEKGIEAVIPDEKGLWLRCVRLPALVSVDGSSAVLRAVSLRARLNAKERAPLIFRAAEPAAFPAAIGGLSRPKDSRSCTYPGTENSAALASELLNKHILPAGGASTGTTPRFPVLPNGLQAVRYDASAAFGVVLEDFRKRRPELTLLPDTASGRRLAAHLSLEFGCTLLCGVGVLSFGKDGVTVRRKVCAANLDWTKELRFPAVLTLSGLMPDSVALASPVAGTAAPSDAPLWERRLEAPAEGGLSGNGTIVICGMGAGSAGCKKARALAQRLGAGFGLTRSAALNGWGPMDEIVGQSGKVLSPSVCLVLGASGARAFTAGIEDSGLVIAVNTDKDALIFRHADIGIRADAPTLIDALLTASENMEVKR